MTAFTALNGEQPKPAEDQSTSPSAKRAVSEERQAVPASMSEPRSAGEVASSSRENWSAGSGGDRPSLYQPSANAETESAHKRKRSYSPNPRPESQQHGAREERERSAPQTYSESHDPYGSSTRDRDRERDREREYRSYGDEGRERSESWYGQHHREERGAYEQQNSAGSVPSQTEEQIGDALRRASDAEQNASPTSPDVDDYYGPYTPEQRRDGTMVQSDPKKRKRNFSNRTKTGCLTCRKRKKKCDETKPECECEAAHPVPCQTWNA
jgi:hypothetical protein